MKPTLKLEMTREEFEQIKVDCENAITEFEVLSADISWYATEMPERLRVVLAIIERAE
jgi:hypothetical protein